MKTVFNRGRSLDSGKAYSNQDYGERKGEDYSNQGGGKIRAAIIESESGGFLSGESGGVSVKIVCDAEDSYEKSTVKIENCFFRSGVFSSFLYFLLFV